MYRATLRSAPARFARVARQPVLAGATRRMVSTVPASKKGTWKGSALRWGVAIGALYWYSTSPIFADETAQQVISAPPEVSDAELRTIDALVEEKRKQEAEKAETIAALVAKEEEKIAAKNAAADEAAAALSDDELGPANALEEEAGQQGAFNPETGEINWDCPCLGGMAHGPCGEDFKAAFSCFVFSEEEPKGMDCIEKFQHMQDCFRKYPEVYGAELADDDEAEAQAAEGTPATIDATSGSAPEASAPAAATASSSAPTEKPTATSTEAPATEAPATKAPATEAAAVVQAEREPKASKPSQESAPAAKKTAKSAKAAKAAKANSAAAADEEGLLPKAAFDATGANK